jgi:chromosomal replication initiator protein
VNAIMDLSLTRDDVHTLGTCPLCGALDRPRLMVAHIQAVVAAYYEIPVAEMYSARRDWAVSHPRQVAMYLSKEMTPKSLPDLARRFGGRDHTTIMWALKQVKKRIENDAEVAADVEVLRERLEA